ncbi:MAG: hypothetical protein E7522_10100 [Ruminococcaceae bacterium]|nr:hypothetical protein [Oscillospiraceae bacterium]
MKEKIKSLDKKQKIILVVSVSVALILFIIIFKVLWDKGIENGTIDVSLLPIVFTTILFFIIPFIVVVILTVIFAKKYFEKKNVLTLYEKTFGLINDEEYDLSVYQSYLDEDN